MDSRIVSGLLLALGVIPLAGCSTAVDHEPHTAADEKAMASVEAAGGDVADWRVSNGCRAVGPCAATLSPATRPELVVARNSYRVKDSFPWLLGDDEIRAAVTRSERDRCLERFTRPRLLARCIAGV